MQILAQFSGTYLRECPGNKVLWIRVFFFSFLFVEMFQSSLNCKSSLNFFSAEFLVEFSFSCLTWLNFSSRLSFNFTFISWEALFKKRMTKPFCWLKFSCLQFGPQIRTFVCFWFYYLGSSIQEASDETHPPAIFFPPTVWSPNLY